MAKYKAKDDLNTVTMIGRLTRDAELKQIGDSEWSYVCNFSLANGYRKKSSYSTNEYEQETNFFDCAIFGKQGKALSNYLTKGQQLAVTGSLRQDRWTDKSSGEGRSKIKLLVDKVQFIGSNKSSSADENTNSFNDGLDF